MTKRLRVAVLAGGPSAEHDVSLQSAQTVLDALPGDPVAMAREAESSNPAVAVHMVEDVAGAVRRAADLLALGDVVLVRASSEYGLGVCAREPAEV
ncbi:D-ala D-ala ligase N-terminus [Sinosporangium album]|uniref:D-ala D-ala ligase N-terminus n=1 Tax=Sinosporangium album TaxID=504805 RepID=A0A1G8JBC6_9ACTN|nr:hypothetical protein [Sinosporangium album]SDI28559.1 D-ala D-ala ligase N-terminus [Sinosporangium album]